MRDIAITVQKVINTLNGLEIKATDHNLEGMLASIQALGNIRDRLLEISDMAEQRPTENEPEEENLPEVEVQEIEPAEEA